MSQAHVGSHQCLFSNGIPCQCGSTRGCICEESLDEYTELGLPAPTADTTCVGSLFFLWKKPFNADTLAVRTQHAKHASHTGVGGGGSRKKRGSDDGRRRQEGDVRGILLSARASFNSEPPKTFDNLRAHFSAQAEVLEPAIALLEKHTKHCTLLAHTHCTVARTARRRGVTMCSKPCTLMEHVHDHSCTQYWFPAKGSVLRRHPEDSRWAKNIWDSFTEHGVLHKPSFVNDVCFCGCHVRKGDATIVERKVGKTKERVATWACPHSTCTAVNLETTMACSKCGNTRPRSVRIDQPTRKPIADKPALPRMILNSGCNLQTPSALVQGPPKTANEHSLSLQIGARTRSSDRETEVQYSDCARHCPPPYPLHV